jgi:hypothetical protein
MNGPTAVAPSALPLEGAPPANRQSRIRGGRSKSLRTAFVLL